MMNFKRRLFLRGLGGAAVAAPFLSSVAERAAKAQGTTLEVPKRLIVMFTHYGCLTDRWFPENSHGPLSAADFEGTSIESLGQHADKILLPRGIRAMNQWTADMSLGQGNDPHTQVCGSYFTCVPVTPHSDNPFDFDEAKKFNAMPTAASLDHICAWQLNREGVPLLMQVGDVTDTPHSAVSYSAGEELFAGEGDLAKLYSDLTGLLVDGEASSPDAYKAQRGQSLIDLVKDDIETLERFDMSLSDKQKLAAWKELLHSTGNQMRSAYCSRETVDRLALIEGAYPSLDWAGGDISAELADGLDAANLYSNLAVLSAICDANRVIFLKYPPQYTFRALDLIDSNQNLSGRMEGTGNCIPGVNEDLEIIDRFYAEKFAHLIGQLDDIDEGETSLLDNSATVWFQQMSDGYAYNLNNMPIVQAGGCSGYFKTGQAVNVHDGTSNLHRGNSEIGCSELGGVLGSIDTGTPEEIGNAPINKYFCNLMNAIGVKADETGFPAIGGNQEVTHYGMYDDTRDFWNGGKIPPKINSPGGFDELKAKG